jgi:kumamolisin
MANEKRTIVPGSDRKPLPGAKRISALKEDEIVHATVILRRRQKPASVSPGGLKHESREQYEVVHGASASDLAAVERFAHAHGLTVSERHPERRSIVVSGTAEAIQQAFGTELAHYETSDGVRFRGRTGSLSVTEALGPAVMAVLGLDNRPVAKAHFRPRSKAGNTGSFQPTQLAQLYNFPIGVNGTGQTIAIIELGGGYKTADLSKYFSELRITEPKITAVSVDGGQNKPGGDADDEVMLDIEVAGAIAPGANIVVYFAGNTDQGFHDAIATAAHDSVNKPSIISISWGGPEDSWTEQARTAMDAALEDAAQMGITVTVAAGDDGSTDGVTDGKLHVDFPASDPNVLACGGTKLVAANGKISSEVVWNELASNEGASGGGISNLFPQPSYQADAGVPNNPETNFQGRGVPDVSGDADPETGYQVRVDGKNTVIGGTSAVAPLWAGLVALINQQLGKPIGFANPLFYQVPETAFRDITQGGNNAGGGTTPYQAGKDWDACTGLGSPNGIALVSALLGKAAAQTGA